MKLQLECGIVVEPVFCHVQRKGICKTANKKSTGRAQTLHKGRSAVSAQKLEIVKPAEKAMLSIAPATKPYACSAHGVVTVVI